MSPTRAAVVLLWLAACGGSSAQPSDADDGDAFIPVDASCVDDPGGYLPVTITGSSPAGDLGQFHFTRLGFTTGDCADAYFFVLTEKAESVLCSEHNLQLTIPGPFTSPGSNPASGVMDNKESATTTSLTFEATELETPDPNAGSNTPPAHVAGHFTSEDAGWTIDFQVDLDNQFTSVCI